MLPRNPRIMPGDPVTNFTAEHYNELAAAIEQLANMSVSGSLELSQGPDGRVISVASTDGFYARVTGSGNPYAWQEVIRQNGVWIDGPRSGTNAYESNG